MALNAAWREYQERVAEFFHSLELDARVDASVQGARAQHDIDVLVEFERIGIRHRWVVECKLWKRRIPKERVLVLQGVVSDVGADRGFMLCEVGFQSGAVMAARFANVTLTNLADLRSNAQFDAQNVRLKQLVIALSALHGRYEQAMEADRAAEPPPYEGAFWVPTDEFAQRLGDVSILDMSTRQAVVGEFPVVYGPDETAPDGIGRAEDLGSFIEKAEPRVAMLEAWLDEHTSSA